MGILTKLRVWGRAAKTVAPSGPSHSTHPPKIVFVSHEATRTGAPLILLHLLRHFQKYSNTLQSVLLHEGGALHSEFAQLCATECLNLPRQPGPTLQRRISQWLAMNRVPQSTMVALSNSMESRFIAEQLYAHGIPIISLVHEMPSSYTESDYQLIYSASQKIVFPAQCVRDATDQKLPIPPGKAVILSQGLLNPNFGTQLNREHSRNAIRHELNLPADALIVMGCGTLDMRKGIDHFARIAIETIETWSKPKPIHFLWIGEGPRWPHSILHYVLIDLEKHGMSKLVHFIGERDDVEPYFMAADVFVMSSRVDPFPCVIHEAMAAGVPIVTFDNNGGACEAIAGQAGIVVPYGDHGQAAQAIISLLSNPQWAQSIAARAKARVFQCYKFSDYGNRILELTQSLLQCSRAA